MTANKQSGATSTLDLRRRPTTRHRLRMAAVVAAALGLVAIERVHSRGWEIRRSQLATQRDTTQAILAQILTEMAATDRQGSKRLYLLAGQGKSRPAAWSIAVKDSETDGGQSSPDLVKVSGANGEFALEPISIVIHDARFRDSLFKRLSAAYGRMGWRFEVGSEH